MSLSSSLLPTCAVRHPVCVRPSCTSWPHRWHRSESGPWARLRTAMRRSTPPTPGALARVRVLVSRSVVTYSTPSAPLAGTSRFHRSAAYTRCLRCAGAPKRPASGSGLSLRILCWHAALFDHGEFDFAKFQDDDVDTSSSRVEQLGTPKTPAIRFTRGDEFRGFLVHTSATACQLARPPERI
jgi:hypothetical protein